MHGKYICNNSTNPGSSNGNSEQVNVFSKYAKSYFEWKETHLISSFNTNPEMVINSPK